MELVSLFDVEQFRDIEKRLNELGALEPGWHDGYGEAIHADVNNACFRLVMHLARRGVSPKWLAIGPCDDGTIDMQLNCSRPKEAPLTMINITSEKCELVVIYDYAPRSDHTHSPIWYYTHEQQGELAAMVAELCGVRNAK